MALHAEVAGVGAFFLHKSLLHGSPQRLCFGKMGVPMEGGGGGGMGVK